MMLQVSYQLQYSKQELRKVIQSYPGKEVKKGLADLYKKVEKHLCEEENLVQVFSFCIVLYVNNVMCHFVLGCVACDAGRVHSTIQVYRGFDAEVLPWLADFSRLVTDILEYFSDIARLY